MSGTPAVESLDPQLDPEVDEEEDEEVDPDDMSDVESDSEPYPAALVARLTRDAIHPTEVDEVMVGNAMDEDDDEEDDGEEEPEYADADDLFDILNEASSLDDEQRTWIEGLIGDLGMMDENPLNQITTTDFRRTLHGRENRSAEQETWLGWMALAQKLEKEDEEEEKANMDGLNEDEEMETELEMEREGELAWFEDDLADQCEKLGQPLLWKDLDPYIAFEDAEDAKELRAYITELGVQPEGKVSDWARTQQDSSVPSNKAYLFEQLSDMLVRAADERIEVYEEQLDANDAIKGAMTSLIQAITTLIKLAAPAEDAEWKKQLEAQKEQLESYLSKAQTFDTEQREKIFPKANNPLQASSSSSCATPAVTEPVNHADALAVLVAERQDYVASIQNQILEILADEDVPLGVSSAWPEQLREVAVQVEQRSHSPILPSRSFQYLVQEIAQDYKNDLVFEPEVFTMLQEASEQYLAQTFDLVGANLSSTKYASGFGPENDKQQQEMVVDLDARSKPLESLTQPHVNPSHVFRTELHAYTPFPPPKSAFKAPGAPPKPQIGGMGFGHAFPGFANGFGGGIFGNGVSSTNGFGGGNGFGSAPAFGGAPPSFSSNGFGNSAAAGFTISPFAAAPQPAPTPLNFGTQQPSAGFSAPFGFGADGQQSFGSFGTPASASAVSSNSPSNPDFLAAQLVNLAASFQTNETPK